MHIWHRNRNRQTHLLRAGIKRLDKHGNRYFANRFIFIKIARDTIQLKSSLYVYIYIFVMAFSTWCMRVIPSLVMKRPIRNRFAQSFLYYVPYVTLAVMTFPAIVESTRSPLAGAAALIVGILAAWFGGNLFLVAGSCCLSVYVVEWIAGLVL